jgi:ribosomal protein S12 methylthiotransferase accessory factor
VVRVVVPGLYGNSPPAFPLHGGRRLYTEPVAQGWVDRPLTDQDLNRPPIPLA